MPVYTDPDTGRGIMTHSMIKTMRRCAKQFDYKYVQRLKAKVLGKPLRQGSWMHSLFETHYGGGDWLETHSVLTKRFNQLFEEEQLNIGDLPTECARMMRSYLWHYKADNWKVIAVEQVLECELPNGDIYRGKIDLLVEDDFGLQIVDHKFNARLPDTGFRLLDAQSALYVWAARRSGIPVDGFIWNYVRRKAPAIPQLLKDGSRFSKTVTDFDYPTLKRAIKANALDPTPYKDLLKYHKSLRFVPGGMQKSTFFRRNYLPRDNDALKQVAREANHTARRAEAYPWDRPQIVERSPDRSCDWCSYQQLCSMELMTGHDQVMLRRQRFTEADPMEYYFDDPKNRDERGE